MSMEKHRLNIFPEAGQEDFDRLVSDIRTNGYDKTMPVIVYEGAILDGWNRWRACEQIGITPETTEFAGTESEAIRYTMRTNKRRNLSSSQWAAIAVEAEEILAAIAEAVEQERRAKQAEHLKETHESGGFGGGVSDNKLSDTKDEHETKTAHKAAELFNTNRTYINDAKKLRESSPEHFEKIKSGDATLTQVKREMKEQARAKKDELRSIEVDTSETESNESEQEDAYQPVMVIGNHTIIHGDNTDPKVKAMLPESVALVFCDPPYNATSESWDGSHAWNQDYLAEIADIVAVTPGISAIPDFMRATQMPYKWSHACFIENGMARGALGFGNWMYTALFSRLKSIHRNAQDIERITIKASDKFEDHLVGAKRQKPPAYLACLFNLLTNEGDTIIDAFGGSGTTLSVAEKLGRKTITIEQDLDSYKAIVRRAKAVVGEQGAA